MSTPAVHRTLVVANRTASTPLLLDEVKRRAGERPTAFTLLVPEVPSHRPADWTLDSALTLMRRAAGATAVVDGRLAGADPLTSVKDELAARAYDDIVISTLPARTSEWLRRDLPRQVQRLGLPVTVVTPEPSAENYLWERFKAYGPKQ